MDIARKFIKMGRTRSLRYALRPGGRKYQSNPSKAKADDDQAEGTSNNRTDKVEIPRTGEVHDDEKVRGAGVFEEYLKKVWADENYQIKWEEWRKKQGSVDVRIPRGFREDDELDKEIKKKGRWKRGLGGKKQRPVKAEKVEEPENGVKFEEEGAAGEPALELGESIGQSELEEPDASTGRRKRPRTRP